MKPVNIEIKLLNNNEINYNLIEEIKDIELRKLKEYFLRENITFSYKNNNFKKYNAPIEVSFNNEYGLTINLKDSFEYNMITLRNLNNVKTINIDNKEPYQRVFNLNAPRKSFALPINEYSSILHLEYLSFFQDIEYIVIVDIRIFINKTKSEIENLLNLKIKTSPFIYYHYTNKAAINNILSSKGLLFTIVGKTNQYESKESRRHEILKSLNEGIKYFSKDLIIANLIKELLIKSYLLDIALSRNIYQFCVTHEANSYYHFVNYGPRCLEIDINRIRILHNEDSGEMPLIKYLYVDDVIYDENSRFDRMMDELKTILDRQYSPISDDNIVRIFERLNLVISALFKNKEYASERETKFLMLEEDMYKDDFPFKFERISNESYLLKLDKDFNNVVKSKRNEWWLKI